MSTNDEQGDGEQVVGANPPPVKKAPAPRRRKNPVKWSVFENVGAPDTRLPHEVLGPLRDTFKSLGVLEAHSDVEAIAAATSKRPADKRAGSFFAVEADQVVLRTREVEVVERDVWS